MKSISDLGNKFEGKHFAKIIMLYVYTMTHKIKLRILWRHFAQSRQFISMLCRTLYNSIKLNWFQDPA